MTRSGFSPASLDLLPGESPRPPLRLLEPRLARGPRRFERQTEPSCTGLPLWLERLRRIAFRPGALGS